jgi:hypothetical protein
MHDVEISPIPQVFEGTADPPPQRYEWLLRFDVPSDGVPLLDSLVLMMRTLPHAVQAGQTTQGALSGGFGKGLPNGWMMGIEYAKALGHVSDDATLALPAARSCRPAPPVGRDATVANACACRRRRGRRLL